MILLPKKGQSLASIKIKFQSQHSEKVAGYVFSLMSNYNALFSRNFYNISDSKVNSSKNIDTDLSASVKKLKSSTVRPFLLLTLSHCERRNIEQSDVIARLKTLYSCRTILVSREPHACGGYHYHIGLETRNASKNNFVKLIRATFPEFDGMQIDVQARKGFGPICAYITKWDKSPLIWGEYNLQQILEKASTAKRNRGFIQKEKKLCQTPFRVKKKRRQPFWFSKVKWILLYCLVHYALNLEIPQLFLFLGEYLSFLFQYLEKLWEGPGAETTPGLPESDSAKNALPIIIFLCMGCVAYVIIKSYN